jgi:hypothetical protein
VRGLNGGEEEKGATMDFVIVNTEHVSDLRPSAGMFIPGIDVEIISEFRTICKRHPEVRSAFLYDLLVPENRTILVQAGGRPPGAWTLYIELVLSDDTALKSICNEIFDVIRPCPGRLHSTYINSVTKANFPESQAFYVAD